MKELLSEVSYLLKQLGYKKKGASFWKVENDFYKLINFQKGAYGRGYFFVNKSKLFTSQIAEHSGSLGST